MNAICKMCKSSFAVPFEQVESFRKGEHLICEKCVEVVPDMVNHPPHYKNHPSGVECIEITRHMNFNLGNVIKYVWRESLKSSSIEDLEKAAFYLNDEINLRKQQRDGSGTTDQ